MNFFLLLNTKEYILKNFSLHTVDGPHLYFILYTFFFHTKEVNGLHQLFGYRHSLKYLLLCSELSL